MINFNNLQKVSDSFTELLGEPVSEGFLEKMTEKERLAVWYMLQAGDEEGARKKLDEVKLRSKHKYHNQTNWYLKQKYANNQGD